MKAYSKTEHQIKLPPSKKGFNLNHISHQYKVTEHTDVADFYFHVNKKKKKKKKKKPLQNIIFTENYIKIGNSEQLNSLNIKSFGRQHQ